MIRLDKNGTIEAIEVSGHLSDEVSRVARELTDHIASNGPTHEAGTPQKELAMDPVTALGAIASVLGLVDSFVSLVGKLRSQDTKPFSVETRQEADALVVRRQGTVVERIAPAQLHMTEFDSVRFEALRKRVTSLWNQFNGLHAQLPNLSVDEKVRIQEKMEQMRLELCGDFREMIDISEKVLGVPLQDHYTLYRTCGA